MEKKLLFNIENLQKYYPVKKTSLFQKHKEYVKANKDISLEIIEGETLGIVGESGCGKSTFGRTLIQLQEQTAGTTMFYGVSIEEFMPQYVNRTYKLIPKLAKDYDKDKAVLDALEAAIHDEHSQDQHRLAKIEFDSKYGNILRLGGGLLVSDDLEKVSDILQRRYAIGSQLSKLSREHHLLEQNYKVAPADRDQIKPKIDHLYAQIQKLEKDFEGVEIELKTLKDSLRGHERFDSYEAKRDKGIDLTSLTKKEMRSLRDRLQIIFQDPYSSLDPRYTVGDIIGESLITHGLFESTKSAGYVEYVYDIMEKCGLKREFYKRYPHQFSGGQRQRIGIARAIALQPKFIVCDEAVSALDVSIQSQIINLLQELKETQNLTYLFITHDLGVVRYISDRIGVMYFGSLVELAPAEELFSNPQHPYTRKLISAIPRLNPEEALFHNTQDPRIEFHYEETGEADRDWFELSPGHFVACHVKGGFAYEPIGS